MKLKCATLFCSLALTNPLSIDAMKDARPLVHSAGSPSASASLRSNHRSITASKGKNKPASLTHEKNAVQSATPTTKARSKDVSESVNPIKQMNEASSSTPPFSGLPSYEESVTRSEVETRAQRAIALVLVQIEASTQTDVCEKEQPSSTPSNPQADEAFSTAVQHTASPFDESDEEYKELLTEAQENHLEDYFSTLLNAAHRGNHNVVKHLLDFKQRPETGTLALRAAIKGGSLETVKAVTPLFTVDIPFFTVKKTTSSFTPRDTETILIESIRCRQSDIFTFISEYWHIQYDHSFLEKALAHDAINEAFLDCMVSRGLWVEPLYGSTDPKNLEEANSVMEKLSPLYKAIKSNNADAVKYFLAIMKHPFTVMNQFSSENYNCYEFCLAAAQTDRIRDMLLERKKSDQEKMEQERSEREQLNREKMEQVKLEQKEPVRLEQEQQEEMVEQQRKNRHWWT